MDDWEDDLLALAEAPAKPKKKSKRKRKRESSASDMELSEGAGSDLEAASVKEEDSDNEAADVKNEDDDDDEEEEHNPADDFPLEGIYKNSKDRSWLQEMTEIERETILEDRRTLIQKYQNRMRLKQLVSGQSSKADVKPKLTGKSKQLDELKKKRQAKNAREEKRSKKRESDDESDEDDDRRSKSPVTFSDDEDPSYAGDKGKKKSTQDTEVEDSADKGWIDRITIPRHKLASLWPTTFFANMVAGAFVRIGVGMRDGEPEYRLAQIVGVAPRVTNKLYQLDRYKTDIMLTLQIGNDKQDMSMEMISNSAPTDREFKRYQTMLTQAKLPLMTRRAAIDKSIDIHKHENYTLTETDINALLTRNKAKATNQKGGAVLHDRHLLVNQRDIALRAGNEEEVARINGQLKSYAGDAAEPQLPMLSTNSPVQAEKKVSTFDERRKQLAAAAGSSTPKAIANKTTSAQNSRPGSGASTPVRQSQAATASSGKKESNVHQGPNRFQKLLAAKVDVDLGDF